MNSKRIQRINSSMKIIENFIKHIPNELTFYIPQLKNALEELKILKETPQEYFDKEFKHLLSEISYLEQEQSLPSEIHQLANQVLSSLKKGEIYHKEYIKPPEYISKDDMVWHRIERLLFRGDTRKPEEIFQNGFTPIGEQPENDDWGFKLETAEVEQKRLNSIIRGPLDSSNNVIAGTSRFNAAAFFPMTNVESTWIYLYKIREGFDVRSHAYLSTTLKDTHHRYFVEEVITPAVSPENVIAAVRIERKPTDRPIIGESDWNEVIRKYGKFDIVELKMNPNCTLPEADITLAKEFIENEMKQAEHYTATPASGYVKKE